MSAQRDTSSMHLPSRSEFESLGFSFMRREHCRAGTKTRKRRFKSWFGAEPVFVAIIWRKLQESGWLDYAGRRPNPVHLLWSLNWMKSYNTEDIGAGLAGVDEKTYREKVWFYLEGMARLDATIVRLSSLDGCWCHSCFQIRRIVSLTVFLSLADSVGQSLHWINWTAMSCVC